MKKEKTIRTYQRRTKTGKIVTVKQHTAKYDAADVLKEATKKKGAGDEIEQRRLDAEWKKIEDDFMKKHPDFEAFDDEGNETKENAAIIKKKEEAFTKKHPSWKGGVKSGPKEKSAKRSIVEKAPKSDSSYGFTSDEYKAWYHWDQDADPKNKSALKVEKALKKQMGTKAYNKYFDELTDNYSARGHNKAFKGLSETFSASAAKKSGGSAKEKDIKAAQESVENLTKMVKDKRFSRLSKKDQQHYKAKLAAEKALLKTLQSGKASSDVDEKAQKTYDKTYKTSKETKTTKNKVSSGKDETSTKYGFSKSDWDSYQNDGSDDKINRRVERGLKKYLGAKAYAKYGDYQDASINGEGVSIERNFKSAMAIIDKFKAGKGDEVLKKLDRAYERKRNADRASMNVVSPKQKKETSDFKELSKQIKGSDIPDHAKKRLLSSINSEYRVASLGTMKKRFQKELDKLGEKTKTPKTSTKSKTSVSPEMAKYKAYRKEINAKKKAGKKLSPAETTKLKKLAKAAGVGRFID